MPRKAVTIRDVAKRAGVGVSTVSYVLNGNAEHVSTGTRDQVLAVAREMNYRPNAIARSMVKQKTGTIGLLITEMQNPLFMPITEGVEEVLRLEGYHILLASAADVQSEINTIELLRGQQVDGFIFMSLSLRFPTDHLEQLEAEDVPFVVINRDLERGQFNQIHFDDRGAGRSATDYLISLGHTRIATITGPREDTPNRPHRRSAMERHEGWQDALIGHGLPICESWIINGNYTYEGGYRAALQLMKRIAADHDRPTAVFISSDMMGIGALRAFAETRTRIPQDLAVIAVGDPPYAAYTNPPLTTLALPIIEAGRVGARILVDWLHDSKPAENQYALLDFRLKVRESTGGRLNE